MINYKNEMYKILKVEAGMMYLMSIETDNTGHISFWVNISDL